METDKKNNQPLESSDSKESPTISRRDALKRIAKTTLGTAGVVAVTSCDPFDLLYDDYYSDYYSNYYSNYYSDYYSNYYSDYYAYYSNYYY